MFDLSFTQQQNVILCKIDIVNRLFLNVIGYESKNPLEFQHLEYVGCMLLTPSRFL